MAFRSYIDHYKICLQNHRRDTIHKYTNDKDDFLHLLGNFETTNRIRPYFTELSNLLFESVYRPDKINQI